MTLLITTLLITSGINVFAQEAKRPVVSVTPITDRPMSEKEVNDRQDSIETPNINMAYEESFNSSVPSPVMPSEFLKRVAKTWEPNQSFSVYPKDSIMIPVGQGLMNTISTNLHMVNAKSNDETSAFEIDEGYLYVTVNTLNPISIILYEEGALETQISVTLVPIPAPPTLVEIEFELTDAMVAKAKQYREDIELENKIQSQQPPMSAQTPYQQSITNMLLPVAQGDIPRGFGLKPSVPTEYQTPCAMTIYNRAKQRLVSHKFVIDVVHVVNNSDQTYNVREEMCLAKYVTAVALFQKAYLQPGEESELYILRDVLAAEKQKKRNRRPSLIGG